MRCSSWRHSAGSNSALRQESWFLARVFHEAVAAGLRGVLSFADSVPRRVGDAVLFPGHIGTIYQATNAVFTGRSAPRLLTLLPNGEVLNERAKSKVRATSAATRRSRAVCAPWGPRLPRPAIGDRTG